MDVPFNVLLNYCLLHMPKTLCIETMKSLIDDLAKKSGYGEESIKNYKSGKRRINEGCTPTANAYRCLFGVIWKRYLAIEINNYKDKAIAFFRYIINSGYVIDHEQAAGWIQRIQNETLPDENIDSFANFIENSQFYDTLYEYIMLWKNQEFREYKPDEKQSRKGAVVPHLITKDDFPEYMTQSLFDTESANNVLTADLYGGNCNFSFFEKNKISLITGPGGQGKTLFLNVLRRIHYDLKDVFDDILFVPLISLTLYEKLPENATKDWIWTYIASNYPDIEIDSDDKKYLILLDGFNEYQAAKNQEAAEKITCDIRNLIKTIGASDNYHLSLVMTAREKKSVTRIFGEIPGMRTMTLSGTSDFVHKRIEEKCKDLLLNKDELMKLADIPLYALMLLDLPQESLSKITDKYSLMNQEYNWRANQRLGSKQHMGAYDKRWYLYYYYVVLPYTAFFASMSDNTYTLRNSSVSSIIEDLNCGGLGSIIYNYLCKGDYAGLEWDCPQLTTIQLRHLMDNDEDKMITYHGNSYRFLHEEWRDFLVAKYLNTVVQILHDNYTDNDFSSIMSLKMNFNVGANVARLILQSFGFCSDAKSNEQAILKFFELDQNTKLSRCIVGVIRFLHLAFDFNEYLQWDVPLDENKVNQTLHKILAPLYRHLLDTNFDSKLKNNAKLRERLGAPGVELLILDVCEILSKVSEYFRRKYLFDKAFKAVNLAKQFDENSDIILQQEAKLYLCILEWKLKNTSSSNQTGIVRDMDEKSIYQTGTQLLTKLASKGFHLSGNTAGILISTPAPILINYLNKDNDKFVPDYCRAFSCYMDVIYGAGYVRRDITYTVRQALNLLLKGYIRVSDDSTFDPEDEFCELEDLILEANKPLFSAEMNQKSLELAQHLIKKAQGQELVGLNYLRGVEKLYSGEKDVAAEYFHTQFRTESTLMSDIRLKYQYGEDLSDKIDQGYRDLIFGKYGVRAAQEGYIDRTHPAFWYIEARELELSLCKAENIEQRKQFFAELEKPEDISVIIETVYRFMVS